MGVAGEAFAVFRDLHAVFGLNPAVIHLAAWLCSRVKFICRDRGGFSGGLLPVLPDSRPVRGEAFRGGAGNGCYGKYDRSGCSISDHSYLVSSAVMCTRLLN